MQEIIWKIIFIIMGICSSMIRLPHMKKYRKTEKIKSRKTSRENFLVFLATVGMMIVPMIYVFTPWLDSFSMSLPDWARWVGVAASGYGLILFWQVHKTLGKNWSPVLEIRKNHNLITEGPYKYIRHPMYTQMWIGAICHGLITSNWIVGIVAFLTWSLLYFIRMPEEEKMMVEEFGQEYKDYMKRTKKIIPGVY
ncbi:MAG: protein-S-isoprenylcysteine O-methyltransferase [Candidatus Altiarchaeota archaeon]|nr:protein-S-isoprenylcysteine O-methyltransferase [Candidatus Altiarchaeota archaeon]